jgi:hypothetical protein
VLYAQPVAACAWADQLNISIPTGQDMRYFLLAVVCLPFSGQTGLTNSVRQIGQALTGGGPQISQRPESFRRESKHVCQAAACPLMGRLLHGRLRSPLSRLPCRLMAGAAGHKPILAFCANRKFYQVRLGRGHYHCCGGRLCALLLQGWGGVSSLPAERMTTGGHYRNNLANQPRFSTFAAP